jgi:two-component system, NarL family, sensor kinase
VYKTLFILILIIFSCAYHCNAQTNKIDSLKKIAYSNKPVAERAEAFLLLLRQSESMPFESFAKTIADAGVLVKEVNTPVVNCRYVYSQAKYYASTGNTDSASILLSTTFEKYKNEPGIQHELMMIEFSLARVTVRKEKYKEGIAAMLAIMKKAEDEKINDKKVWSYAANSIGFSYMNIGRYDEAINWFRKIIELPLKPTEQYDQSSIYDNMASCLNNVSKFDSAMLFVNKGIEKATIAENFTTLANGLSIKADILINMGQKQKAEQLLLEAIEIRKRIGDADYVASDMAQLALYYGSTGQYDKGIDLANQALEIYRENKLISKFMFAYEALKVNYQNKGDYKNYAAVLEKMLSLKDSLYTNNSAEELTALQTKFEVQKKETLIAKQKLDLLQRNLYLYGSIIITLLLLSFLAYRFKKYKQQQKIKLAAIIEEEKKQNELAMKAAEEKERKRIAAELHDNLGVQANAILHNSTLLIQENTNNKNVVADLQETAKEMLLNLRETLWAMKSADVVAPDLWLRIISFMKQMGRHYTTLKFVIEGQAPADMLIASNKALNIVLVLQETVNNSIKHANAGTITVSSNVKDKEWVISIIDDGKGFDIKEAAIKKDSYGLNNMKERAIAGNFRYHIETTPGSGTLSTISIGK